MLIPGLTDVCRATMFRVIRVGRPGVASVALVLLAVPALASCGTDTGESSCAPAYVVQASGKTMWLGGCAMNLPSRLGAPLTATVGTDFEVQVGHEMDGSLDFPVPDSTSGVVVRTGRDGFTVHYRATSPGSAYLVARGTPYCEQPRRASCRIVKVIVTTP